MFEYVRDVPVRKFFEDGSELLHLHWQELACNSDKVFLNPDVDRYEKLQQMDVLKNICVYEGEHMVGYSVLFCQPHIHYSDDVFIGVDVFYVDPGYRNSTIGIKLIKETEAYAKELGASVLTYHTKPTHPTIDIILQRLGYIHYETIFGKCFKE